jgi:hypothetical protein
MKRTLPYSPNVAPSISTIQRVTLLYSINQLDYTHYTPYYHPSTLISYLIKEYTSKMAPKDRTSEFHSTLASIKSRSSLPSTSASTKGKSEAKQPLIPKENGRSTPKSGQGSKSEFGRMAGGIAKDINSTTLKLQKLAQCTSSQLLRPVHRDKADEQWPRERHYSTTAQSKYPS